MANVLTTFVDYECKRETGIPLQPGTVEFHGALASWSSWSTTNGAYILNRAPTSSEVEFSGGTAIYDINVQYNLPWVTEEGGSRAERDDYAYDPLHPEYESFGKVYNINFISVNSEDQYSYCFGLWCDKSEYSFYWNIAFYQYTQITWGDSMNERTSWSYGSVEGISQAPLFSQHSDLDLSGEASNYSQVKVYVAEQDGIKCYVFAFGIKPSGEVGANTRIIAVPFSFFANREPEERTGPVSEDAADESFAELRPLSKDTIVGYSLYSIDQDPLGLCSGNGTTQLVELSKNGYMKLIDAIYGGYAGQSVGTDDLSSLGSIGPTFFKSGGRSASDIQQILSAIQTIHIVPNLNIQSGDVQYATSIGGYALATDVPVYPLTYQITKAGEGKTLTLKISPQTTSFINYSPYTQATLIIPWVGSVNIDPSVLYSVDKEGATQWGTIEMEYAFDVLTGLLTIYTTCYVSNPYDPYEPLVPRHLINVSQVNVATELPISGLGGAGEKTALRAISAVLGAGGAAMSGNAMGAANGVISIADAAIDMSKSYAVSNAGIQGVAPMFAPVDAALILTYPKSFNAGKYAKHIGLVANKSGKVKDFKGYAEFINVDLSSIQAPNYIKEDILSRLKSGVII